MALNDNAASYQTTTRSIAINVGILLNAANNWHRTRARLLFIDHYRQLTFALSAGDAATPTQITIARQTAGSVSNIIENHHQCTAKPAGVAVY